MTIDKVRKNGKGLGMTAALISLALSGWLVVGCGGGGSHDHGDHHDHTGATGQAHAMPDAGSASAAATTSGDSKTVPYPRDTCIVSGEKLGSMGDPITTVHKGHEIKFCCSDCVDQFNENADRYLTELRQGSSESASNQGGHEGHNH